MSKKSHLIVYFWAKWCPVCRGSAPVFKNLARDHGHKIQFVKFEFKEDNVVELGDEIGISGLPNVMVYKDLKRVDKSSVIKGYKHDFKEKIRMLADYYHELELNQ